MKEERLGMGRSRIFRIAFAGLVWATVAAPFALRARDQPTIDELKAQVKNARIPDRPGLCIRISERQLEVVHRLYAAGDSEKAKAALGDVTAFAEQARDYAIQTHKHEKQCEIAIRKETRNLADLKHTVSLEDQKQVQNTFDQLEQVRDDLLSAMFPKGGKK